MNYQDFIKKTNYNANINSNTNSNSTNNNIINENKKLKDELNIYKKENENLKNKKWRNDKKYGIFLGIHDFLWFNLSNNFI